MAKRMVARLAYLYLLRVPIATALLLVAFPILAVDGGRLTTLFENLFQLDWMGTFWVALTAVLTAWSVMFTATLVLVNGSSRVGVPGVLKAGDIPRWVSLAVLLLAVPAMAAQFFRAGDFQYHGGDIGSRIGANLAGVAAAYAVGYLAMLVAVWLAPKGTQTVSLGAFPAWGRLRKGLMLADGKSSWTGRMAGSVGRKLRTYPRSLWAGFLNPDTGEPWSGHWLAFSFATVTFALFELVDVVKRVDPNRPVAFPAAMFVLWLFLSANWMLGVAAFFLDRFRVPLILPFVLLGWAASHASQSDNYFALAQGTAGGPPRILAGDVLKARAGRGPIVVVATAGGGIQAAVCTARVLTGLQKDSLGLNRGSEKWPADFASSLAMVSSVSGGATGSMFFLNRYQDGPKPGFTTAPGELDSIVEEAARNGLDDVAWALVDHDIPRLYWPYSFFPGARRIDRGAALEREWQRFGAVGDNLSRWRTGVADCPQCGGGPAWRPAAIFNSTIVETGRPLLMGTTDLEARDLQLAPLNFYDWQPGQDLPVVTAVRLAATFPYVSPAARPDSPAQADNHAVDGGYFDNYGVATLAAWLTQGREQWKAPISQMPPILVIQIRSFPTGGDPTPTPKSAAFQLYAPLAGLLSVRDTAQLMRNATLLDILRQNWNRAGGNMTVVTLEFRVGDAPLSWAINPHQRQEIDHAWDGMVCGDHPERGCVPAPDLQLLRCAMGAPGGADCAKLREKGAW